MPTDEQLRLKIAEVLGYCTCEGCVRIDGGTCYRCKKPNRLSWPTDRNASYELPVKDWGDWDDARIDVEDIVIKINPDSWYRGELRDAYTESLIWLLSGGGGLYQGWQWIACENEYCDNGEVLEGDTEKTCALCNGEKGEWVKA